MVLDNKKVANDRDYLPEVSVIVPNYNHAPYLKKRIDSILAQTFQNFEIILLDDASDDGSLSIIEHYRSNAKVSIIDLSTTNSGSAFNQWDKGIQLASGKNIWIAESDDFCENNFLEAGMKVLNENPSVDLFYSQSYKVNSSGEISGDFYSWSEDITEYYWHDDFIAKGEDFIEMALSKKNVIVNASAVLFRKNKIDFSMNELRNFTKCGDWLFWIQYLKNSWLYYCKQPLNYFRDHEGSTRHLVNWEKHAIRELEEIAIKKFLQKKYALTSLQPAIDEKIHALLKNTKSHDLYRLNKLRKRYIGQPIFQPFQILISRLTKKVVTKFSPGL